MIPLVKLKTMYKQWIGCGRALTAAAGLMVIAFGMPAEAYGQAATVLAQGQDQFNAGQYEEAAQTFENLVKNYQTSELRPQAEMQAGYAYFLAGDYDKAIGFLKPLTDPKAIAPDAIIEIAYSLLGQATAAKASQLEDGSDEQKKLFEQAIKEYDAYLSKYPRKPENEQALYGRAFSHFRLNNYEGAIKDLQQAVQEFSKSRTILSSKYLLGLAHMAQAGAELQKDNSAAALEQYTEGEKVFKEIITDGSSAALANDSLFQLGEIYFNRGALAGETGGAEAFAQAVEYFRAVKGKAEMVAAQQKLVEEIRASKPEAIRSRNEARIREVQRQDEQESAKLVELQEKDDQTLEAKLKIAQVFYQQGDYDATRVLVQYLKPFLDGELQKERADYFLTISYALQGMVDQAVERYEAFQSTYQNSEIADNLPFSMGSMYLALGQAGEAIPYFQKQMEMYPNSPLASLTTVQMASAQVQLQQYEEALKTFQDYLNANPNAPKEVRAQAEFGISEIYRNTAKWDEAIAQYKKIRSDFADQADQVKYSDFWIGYAYMQKADLANGKKELAAFVQKVPDDKELTPMAMFWLAQTEAALGETEAALNRYAELSEKFPETEVASYAFFRRADIYGAAQNYDQMVAVLQEFAEKYPEDPNLFASYDLMFQTYQGTERYDEAIAALNSFVEKHGENPNAAKALLQISNAERDQANRIGRYVVLDEEQRAAWQKHVDASLASAETVLEKFPESEEVALVLQSLLLTQRLQVVSALKSAEQVEQYFAALAEKYADKPTAQSKILFTQAAYIYDSQPEKAIEVMTAAYNPELRFAPEDLDLFGNALIVSNQLDKAAEVYQKIATDFPNPPGLEYNMAPLDIQQAQSIALFGQGKIAQVRGDSQVATETFEKLQQMYPWSPKIMEAIYGIAEGDAKNGKFDEALAGVVKVIQSRNADVGIRGKAMLLGGEIREKQNDLPGAADYYVKIALLYAEAEKEAMEGLWKGAQIYEKLSAGETDPTKKSDYRKRAQAAYNSLASRYPASPHAEEAKSKAASLAPAAG